MENQKSILDCSLCNKLNPNSIINPCKHNICNDCTSHIFFSNPPKRCPKCNNDITFIEREDPNNGYSFILDKIFAKIAGDNIVIPLILIIIYVGLLSILSVFNSVYGKNNYHDDKDYSRSPMVWIMWGVLLARELLQIIGFIPIFDLDDMGEKIQITASKYRKRLICDLFCLQCNVLFLLGSAAMITIVVALEFEYELNFAYGAHVIFLMVMLCLSIVKEVALISIRCYFLGVY